LYPGARQLRRVVHQQVPQPLLAPHQKVEVLETGGGSASLYADQQIVLGVARQVERGVDLNHGSVVVLWGERDKTIAAGLTQGQEEPPLPSTGDPIGQRQGDLRQAVAVEIGPGERSLLCGHGEHVQLIGLFHQLLDRSSGVEVLHQGVPEVDRILHRRYGYVRRCWGAGAGRPGLFGRLRDGQTWSRLGGQAAGWGGGAGRDRPGGEGSRGGGLGGSAAGAKAEGDQGDEQLRSTDHCRSIWRGWRGVKRARAGYPRD